MCLCVCVCVCVRVYVCVCCVYLFVCAPFGLREVAQAARIGQRIALAGLVLNAIYLMYQFATSLIHVCTEITSSSKHLSDKLAKSGTDKHNSSEIIRR